MEKKQATVSELIEALKSMPPDALVSTEGCDCEGAAWKPILDDDGSVCIARTDEWRADNDSPA